MEKEESESSTAAFKGNLAVLSSQNARRGLLMDAEGVRKETGDTRVSYALTAITPKLSRCFTPQYISVTWAPVEVSKSVKYGLIKRLNYVFNGKMLHKNSEECFDQLMGKDPGERLAEHELTLIYGRWLIETSSSTITRCYRSPKT